MERTPLQLRVSRPVAVLLILVSLLAVYVIDKITGLVPDVTVLYLAPIVAGVYFFGLWGGLITSVGALVGVAAAHPVAHWASLAFDVAAHFGVFVFAVIVIDRLRQQLQAISTLESQRDYDLRIARELQDEILRPPVADPRFDVAYTLRFARELGGDYYRFADVDGGFFVCIADIAGKALSAALFAALLNQSIAEEIRRYETLPRFVERVNARLHETIPPEMFVTMFSAVLDDAGMEWVNAGHVPPLLYTAGKVEELPSDGTLPLGIEPSLEAVSQRRALAPGDMLLTCTDGLTESPAALRDPAIVGRVFAAAAQAGPQAAVDALAKLALPPGETQRDDVAIVCVRVRG